VPSRHFSAASHNSQPTFSADSFRQLAVSCSRQLSEDIASFFHFSFHRLISITSSCSS